MGEIMALSQSFAMPSSPSRLHSSTRLQNIHLSKRLSPARLGISGTNHSRHRRSRNVKANVVSDSGKPTTFTIDPAGDVVDVLPDSGGSDTFGGGGGNGGGGGGGGGGGDGGDREENEGGEKKGISMSQKITLGYAALVGLGGLMGYLKGGSKKSLIAGGGSAGFLLVVYALLPSSPVFASALGLGLSAALLGVMGSRFVRSGKVFPAGVVSLASLVMSVGYSHGIFRSSH